MVINWLYGQTLMNMVMKSNFNLKSPRNPQYDKKGTASIFTMTEKIGGVMFPLFANKIPPFDQSFEQFTADLKKEAEAISQTLC
jgi:hypothetical protein